jgi:hypothetical protein
VSSIKRDSTHARHGSSGALDADQLSAGSSLFTAVMRAGLLLGPALGGLCEERVFGVGVLSEQHAGLFLATSYMTLLVTLDFG